MPIFGICLGHQLLGLALGGKTFKLKFGHRGGNQPVQNRRNGQVEITAQNHGFAVDTEPACQRRCQITHLNLNDNTLEGMRHQVCPSSACSTTRKPPPARTIARYLSTEFVRMMERHSDRNQRIGDSANGTSGFADLVSSPGRNNTCRNALISRRF